MSTTRIPQETIDEIRKKTDFAVLGKRFDVEMFTAGSKLKAICPFHDEKSPSLSINPERNIYHCFGCGASGDVFTFVKEISGMSFVETVQYLGEFTNTEIMLDESGVDGPSLKEMKSVLHHASLVFNDMLLSDPDGQNALKYLKERGLEESHINEHVLGWAPRRKLTELLGADPDLLIAAGLMRHNKTGNPVGVFTGRITFPIYSNTGDVISFGGRKLPDQEGPKYVNGTTTRLYDKSRTLYGFDTARIAAKNKNRIVICEGYFDMIGFRIAGVQHSVATCGTALTAEHLKMIKRVTDKVILAYDADAAGEAASVKLWETEASQAVTFFSLNLLAGEAPYDVAISDPGRLRMAEVDADPLLRWIIDKKLEQSDISTPESLRSTVKTTLEVILSHPSAILRQQYMMYLASALGISEEIVQQEAKTLSKKTSPQKTNYQTDHFSQLDLDCRTVSIALATEQVKKIIPRLMFSDIGQMASESLLEGADASLSRQDEVGEWLRQAGVTEAGRDFEGQWWQVIQNHKLYVLSQQIPFVASGKLSEQEIEDLFFLKNSDITNSLTEIEKVLLRNETWLQRKNVEYEDPEYF